eukprot:CAMPEP_0117436622 /NCGR_PEP_ID=MMETSP0759-20121206/1102_1 /TAXON_ID=63605 /ORGANISM="Percolomonas cosmopolitus, Strain WS" /LENGTH=209 /DNA_ID=CAMNT_0005228227 /DNA_START=7 /DNA_END=636 /DNA_ORIENTATION=-
MTHLPLLLLVILAFALSQTHALANLDAVKKQATTFSETVATGDSEVQTALKALIDALGTGDEPSAEATKKRNNLRRGLLKFQSKTIQVVQKHKSALEKMNRSVEEFLSARGSNEARTLYTGGRLARQLGLPGSGGGNLFSSFGNGAQEAQALHFDDDVESPNGPQNPTAESGPNTFGSASQSHSNQESENVQTLSFDDDFESFESMTLA